MSCDENLHWHGYITIKKESSVNIEEPIAELAWCLSEVKFIWDSKKRVANEQVTTNHISASSDESLNIKISIYSSFSYR